MADEGFIYQKLINSGKNGEQGTSEAISLPILVQTLWETRELQVINHVNGDERIQSEYGNRSRAEAFAAANIRSSLIVPLIWQQELMAVLALHQCSQERIWGEDEIHLVLVVADQAALALSQAYAYDQVRALAKRKLLINTITSTIRSSLDPEDIFAAITQQLGQALQVERGDRPVDAPDEVSISAIQCWTSLEEFFGVVPCTIMSMMSNNLMSSACEVDICGVVGMHALQLASQTPSALLDWNNNYGEDPTRPCASIAATCPSTFSKRCAWISRQLSPARWAARNKVRTSSSTLQ